MMQRSPMQTGIFVRVVPPLLLTLTIFGLGLSPGVPNVPGVRFADKVQHAIVFLVLGYSYLRAGRYLWPEAPAVRVRVLAGALAVSVGALLEVLQAFVPYRSAEWFDLWADCLGVGLGMMAARLVDGPMYPCNG